MRSHALIGAFWVALIAAGFVIGAYSLWVSEFKPAGNSNRVIRDGIMLQIESDKSRYVSGELVYVTAILRNEGSQPVVYYRPTPCDPDFDILLRSQYGDMPLLDGKYSPRPCIQVISERVLEPGQVIVRRVVWDQTIWVFDNPVKAPPGRYQILAVFRLGGLVEPSPILADLVVSIWIEILP